MPKILSPQNALEKKTVLFWKKSWQNTNTCYKMVLVPTTFLHSQRKWWVLKDRKCSEAGLKLRIALVQTGRIVKVSSLLQLIHCLMWGRPTSADCPSQTSHVRWPHSFQFGAPCQLLQFTASACLCLLFPLHAALVANSSLAGASLALSDLSVSSLLR